MNRKPKLIVFDLDYTLWPFWVDTHVAPPFTKQKDGTVKDISGQIVKHYPGMTEMFEYLSKRTSYLAVASRTSEITGANQLLDLFDWNKYLFMKEIYPGSKIKHFKSFHQTTTFDYKDMLFFDDEPRNIRDVSQLGVTCILVEHGMSMELLERGLTEFRKQSKPKPPSDSTLK